MIIEDITFTDEELKTEVSSELPLITLIPVRAKVLQAIKLFLDSYDSNEWLYNAGTNVLVNLYINEAKSELIKAKRLRDENYKKETKREVWKEIFKNPIKSLWLLKLK